MDYPFLTSAFLEALEDSGSVGPGSGWLPCHLRLESEGRLQATMPLYQKAHSWGEYVFDWSWAEAYGQHGLAYYPKLVTAIPFTPATGPRVQFSSGAGSRVTCTELVDRVMDQAGEAGASSWHLLFPDSEQLALFDDPRLLHRHGSQFHWFNRNYGCFDDFLDTLSARKRKMIRRERRRVAAQGIATVMLQGQDISPDLWDFFYRLYQRTYLKRSGSGGYLTRSFFQLISRRLGDQVLMAVALTGKEPVACALFFRDDTRLYGRYWGCLQDLDCLHFELCYYRGIDYAIDSGLRCFDAGAQGEHKILRGFEPVLTHSLHWIAHPVFAEAIGDYLARERLQVRRYMEEARQLLPYRLNNTNTDELAGVDRPGAQTQRTV